MATSKKFSELPAASSVGNGDLFAIAHEDAQAETGYVSQKLTAAQAGQKVNGDTEYPTSLPSFPANGQNPFAALEKLNSDIIGLLPVSTASGSIANFTTSLELPLAAMSAQIVAQQAGTGTPTPQNVRSISGVSSVKFVQTGKNLFDKNNLIDGKIISSDGSITDSAYAKLTDYIPINGQCTFSAIRLTGSAGLRLGLYDENKTFISRMVGTQGTTGSLAVVTVNNSNVKFVRANMFTTSENIDTAQVEQGTTATTYESYTGNTFTIALGQTVYGGSVDAKNGNAVITHQITDLGDYEWTRWTSGSDALFYNTISGKVNDRNNYLLCSCFASINNSATGLDNANGLLTSDNSIIASKNTSQPRLMVRCNTYSTAEDFKTAVTGQKVVYELATPIEITGLTPANFTTFAGENNIFADTGDISVSFKQGIQEYIDAKIAETQALIL